MTTHVLKSACRLAALGAGLSIAGCGGGGAGGASVSATISVLSSRADMVTGGSALVRVALPKGTPAPRIMLAGTDITDRFKAGGDGTYQGLASGLQAGRNTISVLSADGTRTRLDLVNHSDNGPVISGPRQQPWICQTASFALPDGSTLGAPQDADCNAPTRILYLYLPSGATSFKPLPSTASVPADAQTTTTLDGRKVNFIVRLETGTLNRGVYQFALLHDPTAEPPSGPDAAYQGWNRKIVFTFGGSAQAGYVQGTFTGGVLNDFMLSRGFAVISSSLNVLGNNANDVLSAESASMTKERFIKSYGTARYTMGWGMSGGSMQQHLIANNYPGLLDGITPALSFPDLLTTVPGATDCSLLSRAFAASAQPWNDAQKAAVSGYRDYTGCTGVQPVDLSRVGWEQAYSPFWLVPQRGTPRDLSSASGADLANCMLAVPDALIYDPVHNRTGARCDLYSAQVNLLGIDPDTGFAARALDNAGVQYGLQAFQKGSISAEQFVELNELAGGYDIDGRLQPGRTLASPVALQSARAYGRINGAENLGAIPIIDWRDYRDPDLHNAVRSISLRMRLEKATGSSANHVILRSSGAGSLAMPELVLLKMDRWLTGIVNDAKAYPTQAAKVVANRPADLVDACYTSTGREIQEKADPANGGQCGALYPYFGDPRTAAGGPLTGDIIKCQLKPLQRSDHPMLTDAQFGRLSNVFGTGVCDYSRPGAGAQSLAGTWLSYSRGSAAALPASP